jgi:putative membrane protein
MGKGQSGPAAGLAWALMALWIALTLGSIFVPAWADAGLWALVVWALYALVHGARRFGAVASVAFLVIALVIANCYENLSIATGFPFGLYTHDPALGPKLFQVPLVVGPIYYGAGYLAWSIANMLLGDPKQPGDRFWTYAMPPMATFIVVGFDLCIDPIGGTIARHWHYAHGGAYFGVPLSNYLGWYLTTWTIFQVFAWYLAATKTPLRPLGLGYWYETAAFWALAGLQCPLLLLVIPNLVVQDTGGWSWRTTDILETGTILYIYTMLAAAVTGALVVTRRAGNSIAIAE